MKHEMTNKIMEADILEAKSNIFNAKAIEKLKINLGGAWKPRDEAHHEQLHNLDYLLDEETKNMAQSHSKTDKKRKEAILLATDKKRKAVIHLANEEHHLLNMAHYLIEASALAEVTTLLEKSVNASDHLSTKKHLKQFKKELKALPIRTEEDQEVFKQLEAKLTPLLLKIEKSTDHPHLFTDAEHIMQMIEQKQTPQKWKHAA